MPVLLLTVNMPDTAKKSFGPYIFVFFTQIQMTAPLKLSYAEKLHKLESLYAKLLVRPLLISPAFKWIMRSFKGKKTDFILNLSLFKNTSRNQERHLDTLHNFVSRATRELIWLNEKEEEEVAYDWSERNTNIARKKEYHAVSHC